MLLKELQDISITTKGELFEIYTNPKIINNTGNHQFKIMFNLDYIYNLASKQKKYESVFNNIVEEINNFKIDIHSLIIFHIKKVDDAILYIFYVNNVLIIVNKKYLQALKSFFNKISQILSQLKSQKSIQINFFTISKKTGDFIKDLSSIRIQQDDFIGLFDEEFKIEIKNFKQQSVFQSRVKKKCFIRLIQKVIIAHIIKKSYFLSNKKHCQRTAKLNSRETPKNYNYDEFIFLKSFNSISFNLNIKDQQIYIFKPYIEKEKECYDLIDCQYPYISNYFGETIDNFQKSFIVIEYIEGKTLNYLDKKIKNKIDLNFYEKIKIMGEIMLSLEYVHSKGIIYRDLKYDNLIIDSNHDAILIDFDKSKIINFFSDKDDEKTGNIGSYYFSAPEQYSSNKYSFNADVFSVGALIYFLINEEKYDVEKEIKEPPLEFLSFKNIYEICLEKSPEKRPNISQIINDFLFNLQDTFSDAKIRKILINLINIRFQLFLEIQKKTKNYIDISYLYYYFGILYFEGILIEKNIKKSIEYFKFSFEFNNSFAQYSLGDIYFKGIFVKQDINKTIFYWTKSANQNNKNASFSLGQLYYTGQFIPVDIEKAIYYLTISSDKCNNPMAQSLLGHIYFEGKYCEQNIEKSIYYLTLAANQNDTNSQFYLGLIYSQGQHCKRDINKSIHYLTLSSDKNHVNSQLLLATIYYENLNKRDINKAIHYFQLAANQNNSEAQLKLGLIYSENKYISKDIDKAIYYLSLSANQNNSEALSNLGFIYCENNLIQKAIECFDISGKLGNFVSYFNLGLIYSQKEYKMINIDKAIHYYTLSADSGYSLAQNNLGCIYSNIKYHRININKAIEYLTKAIKQNHFDAAMNLALIFLDGRFIPLDYNKAIFYLKQSSDLNNSKAQYYLGLIYLSNEFKDIEKAINYFILSSNNYDLNAQYYLGLIYLYYKKDIEKAIYYFDLSANKGNANAHYQLSMIYSDKKYKKKNLEESFKHLKISADKGNSNAQLNLGFDYYKGEYLSLNIDNAILYLKQSAEKYNSEANFILGFIYSDGKHIKKDVKQAIKYYKEASNKYHNKAKNNLGIIYKNGDGIDNNIVYAVELFNEAIKQKNDLFSYYNLSRIYYFGEKIEKNVTKSIQLLENASRLKLLQANVFLFFIFSFDSFYINKNKADFYLQKINEEMDRKFLYNDADFNDIENALLFIREFDLIYSPKNDTLSEYLNFFFDVSSSDQSQNTNLDFNHFEINSINNLFYEGFGIDF